MEKLIALMIGILIPYAILGVLKYYKARNEHRKFQKQLMFLCLKRKAEIDNRNKIIFLLTLSAFSELLKKKSEKSKDSTPEKTIES